MLQFLFDTDHLTLYEQGHPKINQHVATVTLKIIGVSAVTVQESLRGRLALLSGARDGPTRVRRYARLVETVQLFHQLSIVPFDQASEDQFQQLRPAHRRIGTQDLRIAAVALVNHLTVLTRNRRDFGPIPGIVLDDWSV